MINKLQVADLCADIEKHSVTRGGVPISLSKTEFKLLEYMMYHSDTVLTRDQLEQCIWDAHGNTDSNIVSVYIRYLRKKIDVNFEPKLIHTIHGTGYMLSEHV